MVDLVARLSLILVLVGCSSAPAATPTPEPTLSLNEEIASYVRTWGGTEDQYRVILTSTDCDQLATLFQRTVEKQNAEVPDSPEWRAALGYSNAVNSRQLDIDC